jgi:ParB-like chromosome segregation protein Spo0J
MAKNNFMSAMMKADLPKSMYSQDEKIKKELIVLKKLKKFIPPLAPDERTQLEQNILAFGCKDPLIVWETKQGIINPEASNPDEVCYVLIDGHNRHEICQKFGLDFRINLIEIPTLEQAQDFMIDHQLGRRNLSVEQMAYLRGMKYLALKQERENQELTRDKSGKFKIQGNREIDRGGQSDHDGNFASDNRGGQNDHHGKKEKLSEQLAKEFNVGEKTIRRDADFARGLEMLPDDLKNEVLQGKSNLNKADIIEVGKTKDVAIAQEKVQELMSTSGVVVEKKVKQSKDKVLGVLKSYLTTPEECDALIAEIQSIKQHISGM